MKKIVIGISTVIMAIISIIIVMTIDGRRIRQEEVTLALSSAIESSMKEVKINQDYSINNSDEFVADFLEALLIQINSDSTVTVNILDVDYDKGLLSVEVVEDFVHPNGKPGRVSTVKTVILDVYDSPLQEIKMHKLTYYINGEVYKSFEVEEGKPWIVINKPSNLSDFIYWSSELDGSEYLMYDADGNVKTATEALNLYAVTDNSR